MIENIAKWTIQWDFIHSDLLGPGFVHNYMDPQEYNYTIIIVQFSTIAVIGMMTSCRNFKRKFFTQLEPGVLLNALLLICTTPTCISGPFVLPL